MDWEISRKIAKNSFYSFLRAFLSAIIIIALTPFIISKIGSVGFGIWALTGALTNYIGAIDLGISAALVKFVAEYNAKRDYSKINKLISSSFVFNLFLGLFIFIAIFFLKDFIVDNIFRPEETLRDEAIFTLIGTALIFTVNLPFNVFISLLNGLQRMDVTNKISILTLILNGILTMLILSLGYGLKGLIVGVGIVSIIGTLANIIASKRIIPQINFSLLNLSFLDLKKLFGFGVPVQTSVVASGCHFQVDKVLLSYLLGLNSVAYYEIGARLVEQLRGVLVMIITPVMPAASEFNALGDKERLIHLYHRSLKYLALCSIPVFLFTTIMASLIINTWVGPGYERSVFVLQFLGIAYLVNMFTGPGFFILNGLGKPRYGMYTSILATGLNLILSIVLIIKIGFLGAVYGTCLSMLITGITFILIFHKVTKVSFELFIRIVGVPVLLSLSLLIILWEFVLWMGMANIGILLLLSTIYLFLFILIITKGKYIDEFDKALIVGYLPTRFRSIRGKN